MDSRLIVPDVDIPACLYDRRIPSEYKVKG